MYQITFGFADGTPNATYACGVPLHEVFISDETK